MITKEQATNYNNNLFHSIAPYSNPDKCHNWRRSGNTKTWKRTPERFQIPVKHGLYDHSYITNEDHNFYLPEECPHCHPTIANTHTNTALEAAQL